MDFRKTTERKTEREKRQIVRQLSENIQKGSGRKKVHENWGNFIRINTCTASASCGAQLGHRVQSGIPSSALE